MQKKSLGRNKFEVAKVLAPVVDFQLELKANTKSFDQQLERVLGTSSIKMNQIANKHMRVLMHKQGKTLNQIKLAEAEMLIDPYIVDLQDTCVKYTRYCKRMEYLISLAQQHTQYWKGKVDESYKDIEEKKSVLKQIKVKNSYLQTRLLNQTVYWEGPDKKSIQSHSFEIQRKSRTPLYNQRSIGESYTGFIRQVRQIKSQTRHVKKRINHISHQETQARNHLTFPKFMITCYKATIEYLSKSPKDNFLGNYRIYLAMQRPEHPAKGSNLSLSCVQDKFINFLERRYRENIDPQIDYPSFCELN